MRCSEQLRLSRRGERLIFCSADKDAKRPGEPLKVLRRPCIRRMNQRHRERETHPTPDSRRFAHAAPDCRMQSIAVKEAAEINGESVDE